MKSPYDLLCSFIIICNFTWFIWFSYGCIWVSYDCCFVLDPFELSLNSHENTLATRGWFRSLQASWDSSPSPAGVKDRPLQAVGGKSCDPGQLGLTVCHSDPCGSCTQGPSVVHHSASAHSAHEQVPLGTASPASSLADLYSVDRLTHSLGYGLLNNVMTVVPVLMMLSRNSHGARVG